jgi:hypothetical protein
MGFELETLTEYSDEECFENVLALWTHFGRQPRFAELNRPPSTVGSKACIGRWGGWRRALGAFVARVNLRILCSHCNLGKGARADEG